MWTVEERNLFIDTFLVYGRDFKSIAERLKSKNKEQIRQYYYRALEKVNKLLKPYDMTIKDKSCSDAVQALKYYWSLERSGNITAAALGQQLYHSINYTKIAAQFSANLPLSLNVLTFPFLNTQAPIMCSSPNSVTPPSSFTPKSAVDSAALHWATQQSNESAQRTQPPRPLLPSIQTSILNLTTKTESPSTLPNSQSFLPLSPSPIRSLVSDYHITPEWQLTPKKRAFSPVVSSAKKARLDTPSPPTATTPQPMIASSMLFSLAQFASLARTESL